MNIQNICLNIQNTKYQFVKNRDDTDVQIYYSSKANNFLRIGNADEILPYVTYQKCLFSKGFEVPKILEDGQILDKMYFIEESLGDQTIGEELLANQEFAVLKSNDKNYQILLNKTENLIKKQITHKRKFEVKLFFESIFLEHLYIDLESRHHSLIKNVEKKLYNRLNNLESTISHGDFNVFNVTRNGLIDFSYKFISPVGFDVFSMLYHHLNFPLTGDYEIKRIYTLSKISEKKLLKTFDDLLKLQNLPTINELLNEFIVTKAIWSCSQMHKYPKLQAWRHQVLLDLISKYLENKFLLPYFKKIVMG